MDYSEAHKNGFWHEWCKDNHETLSDKIDRFFGKWPDGYNTLMFYHGIGEGSRVMEFCNNGINSGWWTVVMRERDYYINKLNKISWEQIA
ncbi:hypothetical protein [Dyadobacter bucti]|uniref:hypothetical protein n=1 Tax=Dyadobacter bucti TaxID=2572203 RepID=UPI001108474F|nr:hypothetical protein [Dyadobacter bucti]